MLQHDYILEIIEQFVSSVLTALKRSLFEKDKGSIAEVEDAVGALLDLDPATAMQLAPNSLVTMMLLSGMGDSVAGYVCYTLDRVAKAYERLGEHELADLRREQSAAIAESFSCDRDEIPAEFAELEAELLADASK